MNDECVSEQSQETGVDVAMAAYAPLAFVLAALAMNHASVLSKRSPSH